MTLENLPENIQRDVANSDFRVTELGHTLSQSALQFQCKSVFGGVAFPDKRPGFAVIVAMGIEKRGDNHDFALLDEFESVSTREIIRQCGVLDCKYAPAMWIGDRRNGAADRFIDEMNEDLKSPES